MVTGIQEKTENYDKRTVSTLYPTAQGQAKKVVWEGKLKVIRERQELVNQCQRVVIQIG